MQISCEVCGETHQQARGRPRKYCPPLVPGERSPCEEIGEALPVVLKALRGGKPAALLHILEKLEDVEVPRGAFTEVELRRMRAAAFRLASSGRRLAPGTSGRYTRGAKKNPDDDGDAERAAAAVIGAAERAPALLPAVYARLSEAASGGRSAG